MPTKFEQALALTREEHNQAFERFANAFLVHDYPELHALGGKHDGAIDGRIVSNDSEEVILVVQSCVSPKERAKAKILGSISTLEKRGTLPTTFAYCTSAVIGNSLDDVKRDLRREKAIMLEIHDAMWLSQRELTKGRGLLCERYASDILAPIRQSVDPNTLYSGILSKEQQRLAFQYLEAQRIDQTRGGNLTKRAFGALVVYVMKEKCPSDRALSTNAISQAVCDIFPSWNPERIKEIVNGRVEHLVSRKVIHFNKQLGGYKLSADQASVLTKELNSARDRDARFRIEILTQIDKTVTDREIDYSFDRDELARVCHACVLWHMKVQADRFVDPFRSVGGIIYADTLIDEYLTNNPPNTNADSFRTAVMDILPHALYGLATSLDNDVKAYLRTKADLLIMQAFLQVTPDVHHACRDLIGQDIVYLDTSALIRCVAELYSPDGEGPLTRALRHARSFNTRLRIFNTHIDELVSHLRGPVLLEWENHMDTLTDTELEPVLWTAPTLIKVFHAEGLRRHRPFRDLVAEIIGQSNEWENAKEFLIEELGVTVEEVQTPQDNDEWQELFGLWLEHKRKSERLTETRFELLVRNDVNAFATILQMRRQLHVAGENYGHRIWLLTFDSMVWRMPALLGQGRNHLFQLAMSMDYLINYVSTAVQVGILQLPENVLPATSILDETESTPTDFREVVTEQWTQEGEKKYMRERRLRDLIHDLKAKRPELRLEEGLEYEAEMQEPL